MPISWICEDSWLTWRAAPGPGCPACPAQCGGSPGPCWTAGHSAGSSLSSWQSPPSWTCRPPSCQWCPSSGHASWSHGRWNKKIGGNKNLILWSYKYFPEGSIWNSAQKSTCTLIETDKTPNSCSWVYGRESRLRLTLLTPVSLLAVSLCFWLSYSSWLCNGDQANLWNREAWGPLVISHRPGEAAWQMHLLRLNASKDNAMYRSRSLACSLASWLSVYCQESLDPGGGRGADTTQWSQSPVRTNWHLHSDSEPQHRLQGQTGKNPLLLRFSSFLVTHVFF